MLKLVPNCGTHVSGRVARIDVRPQFVPRHKSIRRKLDGQNLLCRNPALVVQPLPDHSLRDPHLLPELGLGNLVSLEIGSEFHGPILATLVPNVNSKLLDKRTRRGDVHLMGAKKRPRPGDGIPKAVMVAEGKALGALWKSRATRTQDAFATEQGFSQGNFSHYIGGRRPIPLDIGIAITKELACDLEDFSPRLAEELLTATDEKLTPWPFSDLSPDRLTKLSPGQLRQVEGKIMEELERIETRILEGKQQARASQRRRVQQ